MRSIGVRQASVRDSVRVVRYNWHRLTIAYEKPDVFYFLRQLISFLLLPGVVAVAMPVWLARRNPPVAALGADAMGVALLVVGVCTGVVGLWLFGYSLAHFISRGRGTLAPWDPPRRLVVSGPYRFVRNPMISGVCFVLVSEALILRSPAHGWWAAAVLLINAIYIPLIEEPTLHSRVGEPYREYSRHVRRLLPRLRPWQSTDG
jgi:protein-S-isoprenylcysteine O-methyltransferase Ste14